MPWSTESEEDLDRDQSPLILRNHGRVQGTGPHPVGFIQRRQESLQLIMRDRVGREFIQSVVYPTVNLLKERCYDALCKLDLCQRERCRMLCEKDSPTCKSQTLPIVREHRIDDPDVHPRVIEWQLPYWLYLDR